MSTAAQITANIANAQKSSGARTEEGQKASSQNATRTGLYTEGDFVLPYERKAYAELQADLQSELSPVGTLEQTLVNEIRRATWRLWRCGKIETNLASVFDGEPLSIQNRTSDPMESGCGETEKTQRSVDRARAQSHRLLKQSMAELRKLQTERHARAELCAEGERTAELGLADCRAIAKATILRAKLKIPAPKTQAAEVTPMPAPAEPTATPELQRAA